MFVHRLAKWRVNQEQRRISRRRRYESLTVDGYGEGVDHGVVHRVMLCVEGWGGEWEGLVIRGSGSHA